VKQAVDAIEFPVLCFCKRTIRVEENAESLTTKSLSALNKRDLDGMFLVDSDGRKFTVLSATPAQENRFWEGFGLLFNIKVKVRLEIREDNEGLPLKQVSDLVLNYIDEWHGFSTRDDFEELREQVQSATSIAKIMELLR